MKIAVIGTGVVGRTLAGKFVTVGHEVMMGTRNVSEKLASGKKDDEDNTSFNEWLKINSKVKLGTFAEAASFGELVINATPGGKSVEILKSAGRKNLSGKVLIDLANAMKWSENEPPSLLPEFSNTTSLGEEIQKAFPETKVVKTFNTIWCGIMVDPGLVNGGEHVNFLSGNDSGAKAEVRKLLRQIGWKDKNLVDLGDITAARAVEAYLLLWARVMGVFGTQTFSVQLVK